MSFRKVTQGQFRQIPNEGRSRTATNSRLTKFIALILAAISAILAIFSVVPALGLAQPVELANTPPRVLVFLQATGTGNDLVSITYPGVLSRDEAKADLDRLIAETGWKVSNVQISSIPEAPNEHNAVTSIDFTTPAVVNLASGGLLVEPFVKTFRRLVRIDLVYIVPSDFSFVGLKHFENKFVKIVLQRGTNTYRYSILIKNQAFGDLNLPFLQPEKPDEAAREVEPERRTAKIWTCILILGLAFTAGGITYIATSWFVSRAKTKA